MKYPQNLVPVVHAAPVSYANLTLTHRPEGYRSQLEKLKSSLLRRLNTEYADAGANLVHQAVNEADALASLTTEPLLFLPALAEEKVQQIAAWSAHQRFVLQGRPLALAA